MKLGRPSFLFVYAACSILCVLVLDMMLSLLKVWQFRGGYSGGCDLFYALGVLLFATSVTLLGGIGFALKISGKSPEAVARCFIVVSFAAGSAWALVGSLLVMPDFANLAYEAKLSSIVLSNFFCGVFLGLSSRN